MRDYHHQPDEAFARQRWDHVNDDFWGLPHTLGNHEKFADGESLTNVVMQAQEGLALSWGLGLPLERIRAFLAPVPPVIGSTLDADVELDDSQLFTCLNLPIIIGDRANALRLADLAVDMPLDTSTIGLEVGSRKVRALALLVLDRADDARPDIDTIGDLLDSPAAGADLNEKYPHLAAMLTAIAGGDNGAWLAAAAEHARQSDAYYGSSDNLRRNHGGLLSRDGAALARLAHATGTDLPDHPIFAAELIRNL